MRSPPGSRLARGRWGKRQGREVFGGGRELAQLMKMPLALECGRFRSRRLSRVSRLEMDLRPLRMAAAGALRRALETRQDALMSLALGAGLRRPDKVWPRLVHVRGVELRMVRLIERWDFWQATAPGPGEPPAVPFPGVKTTQAGLECALVASILRWAGEPCLGWPTTAYPALRRGVRLLLEEMELVRYRAIWMGHARDYWFHKRKREEKKRAKWLAAETARVQAEMDREAEAQRQMGA